MADTDFRKSGIQFDDSQQGVRIHTASGVVEIKRGRSKNFFVGKDGRLHLLDCTCEVCQKLRAPARTTT
jgi:hypothetical protein